MSTFFTILILFFVVTAIWQIVKIYDLTQVSTVAKDSSQIANDKDNNVNGYLMLAEKLYTNGVEFAEAWNFGPNDEDAKPVSHIVSELTNIWGEGAGWIIDDNPHLHETHYLKLDISKVKMRLKWKPTWGLNKTLQSIIEWHQSWLNDEDMRCVTLSQINNHENKLKDMINEND